MKGDAAFNRRVLRVFENLLEAPPATWAHRLDTTCADEPQVRDAVRAMIDAHRSGNLLPTLPPAPRMVPEDGPAPSRVGQYRVLSELGRGGMGVVYLAERADGLFDHRVAIKLMRHASLSERARAKFTTERQILARLRHPHVAQMHDGGTTESGAPYMVMECIEGAPITEHCDAKRVDLHGRIALFNEACAAIEFAHRNLVVHADIKPSNVVVEEGFGVKLLDFGVARLLDELVEAGDGGYTRGYASPARVAGSPATPADDVYSAGALLGELIAGQPGVDGDLTAIVARATATDAQRRYGAMGELIDDLGRWEAHRPVRAAPPGRRRRAALFWRRHRLGLSVAAVLTLVVAVGLTIVSALYLQSERRRALADQRYAAVQHMADYIFGVVDPGLAHVPGALATRERLLRRTGAYLAGLERDGDAPPALKREIAAGYLRMAKVYGLDPSGGIGDLPAAQASLARADRLIDSAAAADPDAPELWKLRGEAKLLAASAVYDAPSGPVATESLAAAQASQAMYRRYLRQVPGDIDAQLALWTAEVVPERAYNYLGRPAAGLPAIERDLVNAKIPVRTAAQRKERDFTLNGSYLLLGEGYSYGQPGRALAYFNRLVDGVRQLQVAGQSDWELDLTRASGLAGRARLELDLHDAQSALRDDREAVQELHRLYLADGNHVVGWFLHYVEMRLGNTLAHLGRFAEARQASDASLAWFRSELVGHADDPSRRRMYMIAVEARALLEDRASARDPACRVAREAMKLLAPTKPGAGTPSDSGPDGPLANTTRVIAKDC